MIILLSAVFCYELNISIGVISVFSNEKYLMDSILITVMLFAMIYSYTGLNVLLKKYHNARYRDIQ